MMSISEVDFYQLIEQRFTFEAHGLLLGSTVSFIHGYLQYYYAIKLLLSDGKGPIPIWLHLFYLAHDSAWAVLFTLAAPQYNNHWFMIGSAGALYLWSVLEIFCIYRAVTKSRDAEYGRILGRDAPLALVMQYNFFVLAAMYVVVFLGIQLMGKGSFMQWGFLTNNLMVLGCTHDILNGKTRLGLSRGFCLVNVSCMVWTYAPWSMFIRAVPEVFNKPGFFVMGIVMTAYAVWLFIVVAKLPPKRRALDSKKDY